LPVKEQGGGSGYLIVKSGAAKVGTIDQGTVYVKRMLKTIREC
jgi:hypothetical protein